jgi:DNA-directed RNA polymerase alpha subunit
MGSRLSDRDYEMLWSRLHGRTLESIGSQLGLSSERIRQRLTKIYDRVRKAERKWAAAEETLKNMARQLKGEPPSEMRAGPMTIDDLDLPNRAMTVLRDRFYYVEDLSRATRAELLRLKNFGRKSLLEVQSELDVRGISHLLGEE